MSTVLSSHELRSARRAPRAHARRRGGPMQTRHWLWIAAAVIVVGGLIVSVLWVLPGNVAGPAQHAAIGSGQPGDTIPRSVTTQGSTRRHRHHRSTANVPALPNPPANPPGQAATGPWKLAFDDEFTGSTLNRAKWSTCYAWGCTNTGNPETEWYEAANVSIGGGVATLSVLPQAVNGKQYTSGMIESDHHFDFTYGYVEARVKIPAGRGLWPAVWMLPANEGFPPEIDLLELWGANPTQAMLGVHYGAKNQHADSILTNTSLTTGFHTFAVDWEPHGITWYFDGKAELTSHVSVDQPMYLIANLATLGSQSWNGTGAFPAHLEVDFMRVWQHR